MKGLQPARKGAIYSQDVLYMKLHVRGVNGKAVCGGGCGVLRRGDNRSHGLRLLQVNPRLFQIRDYLTS